ncbi:MAG: hypothetical protein OIF51_08710, partial [Cellvibrionaceae bacterium]|nr:hypothetical protein [Cellvibrionaceae bacterium]
AWYHLINIMLNTQVKIGPLEQGPLPEQHYQYLKHTGIDTQITITGNIQSLLTNADLQPNYKLALQEAEIQLHMGGGNLMMGHPVKTGRTFPHKTLYSFKTEQGMIHYLKSATGKSLLNSAEKRITQAYSEWQLRLQLQINDYSFPAPEMHKGKVGLRKVSDQPNFNDNDQPGWLTTYIQEETK